MLKEESVKNSNNEIVNKDVDVNNLMDENNNNKKKSKKKFCLCCL